MASEAEASSNGRPAAARGGTMYELFGMEQRRRIRELPVLVKGGLRLAWRSGRRELLLMVALEALEGAGLGASVIIGRQVLDGIVAASRGAAGIGGSLPSILLLVGLTLAVGLIGALQRQQQQLLGELTSRYAEDKILEVACAVELAAFDDPGFHDHVARVQAGVVRAPQMIMGLAGLARSFAGAIGAVAALLTIAPVLAPFAIFALLPSSMAASRRGDAFYRFLFGMTPRDRERSYLARLLTDRDSAKEVRAFQLDRFLRGRHKRLYDERIAQLRRLSARQFRYSLIADLVTAALIGGALALLIALAVDHELSLASAAAAAAAIMFLTQRLTLTGLSTGSLYESALFIRDFAALGQATQNLPCRSITKASPVRQFNVVARNVTFTYPGAISPAVRDISLEIRPDEVVALVGANGSGKTTLAKLLAGLYVPDSGSVWWDGLSTAEQDRDDMRRRVAVIFQDFVRYALPARENIALGRHERFNDLGAIEAAARRAHADRDLRRLPHGYETLLGPAFEGGVDLSLGQWQRVALARVFFRDAPFVILDEPTAVLDSHAEHALFESIRRLLAGRSVLLISHRLATVRSADRIYVLTRGSVAESGTHASLMKLGGLYTELYDLQASAYR